MTQELFIGRFYDSLEDVYRSRSTASLKRSIMFIKEAMQKPRNMEWDGFEGEPTYAEKLALIDSVLKERGEA